MCKGNAKKSTCDVIISYIKIHRFTVFQTETLIKRNFKRLTELLEFFPKWSRTFTEFIEFRETAKSLKHELA